MLDLTLTADVVFARPDELRALLRLTTYLSGFRVVDQEAHPAVDVQDVPEHR